MNLWQSIRTGFRKYADFTVRASRSEFWWWVLFTTLVNAVLNAVPLWISSAAGYVPAGPSLSGLWTMAVLVPTLAVAVRRLRDAGFGWGHALWLFLPIAGVVVLAVLCSQPSRTAPASPVPTAPVAVG
ncbi:DUF805 domain-containing protein [Naasia sp. SYSU D00057]|uniref:DUF805 domain-containing protein n=1 Tax=Naasia sp. SYSU D00057 TaxID=2817380 RepID=UPI001B307227|nr:DUF805 domain-containing protein [Naasia sp. SYSU D00057]